MTPGQQVRLLQQGQSAIETARFGYTADKSGKRRPATEVGTFDPADPATYGTGQLDYNGAIRRLTNMGLPKSYAQNLADQYYSPGNNGRPVVTPQEGRSSTNWVAGRDAAINTVQRLYRQGATGAADLP
jgi:hypothetical protein